MPLARAVLPGPEAIFKALAAKDGTADYEPCMLAAAISEYECFAENEAATEHYSALDSCKSLRRSGIACVAPVNAWFWSKKHVTSIFLAAASISALHRGR